MQPSLESTIENLTTENEQLRDEIARLNAILNLPRTDEFFESVRGESAHQIERWGATDGGKNPADWFWLLGYLAGKAISKPEKRLHHIISSAACLLNWWRHEEKINTEMRPGISTPAGER